MTTLEKETSRAVDTFMDDLVRQNPNQPEFHQAVREVVETLMPFVLERPEYQKAKILARITEPDRVISWRVAWEDDRGDVHVNRAWRVQFNNAIGPYKGGLRFHPSVTESVLKFLGFEQIFKNSLTGLPMGGGKGGSNFDPKGKSNSEVMRFCQSMMTELQRHIDSDVDVPAGDIGVGAREIGFLFGQYKRIQARFTGVLTGKGLSYGGSLVRKEATGYGCVYFIDEMLKTRGDSVSAKTCSISGSGNVALYAAEKVIQLGGKVVSMSDSAGTIHDPAGIDVEKLAWVKELKEIRRGRIREYADTFSGSTYHENKRPWHIPCQIALPCATQNELDVDDAAALIGNGVIAVGEGANMPSTLDAAKRFVDKGVLFAPAKAANAGGVAVSGLEQSQNAMRLSWSPEEVDTKLKGIMHDIHQKCLEYGQDESSVNYIKGANIAGFVKVADAMLAYGIY
ncbi:NADP-specific glutamate dehydrogenase [Haliangium ochraceum]|uniref:Glutamate dehydrogenase n=1 Tax=Haliangium ochraceum (strain DSM 14365 / JCM 11303 / SMP-2) TaxID=502025 RepID=D0LGK4_HALO1|nr:NADP-specific glutamate dehydrogenase [Haliangium ochraceum]ACY12750.1 Glutamate dehydrogenase (NADP(+)) [Haliangium ochraceum DSM 14365]